VPTSETVVLFPIVDMLGPMPDSSSSYLDFLSVKKEKAKRRIIVNILSKETWNAYIYIHIYTYQLLVVMAHLSEKGMKF